MAGITRRVRDIDADQRRAAASQRVSNGASEQNALVRLHGEPTLLSLSSFSIWPALQPA